MHINTKIQVEKPNLHFDFLTFSMILVDFKFLFQQLHSFFNKFGQPHSFKLEFYSFGAPKKQLFNHNFYFFEKFQVKSVKKQSLLRRKLSISKQWCYLSSLAV